jgi:tripartite-type tricarboxylate transporter receptor subunit TctC
VNSKSMLRILALCALAASFPAIAQQHRILVGFPPGGVVDQLARVFAERLRDATGHPFIVETRSGATGQIAINELLQAPRDGTTMLMAVDSNLTIQPHLAKKPSYVLSDFSPVAHAGDFRIGVAVNPAVPAADFQSFVAWSQKQPGPVGYGMPGAGGTLHLYGVLLAQVTGAKITPVPYKGTGPAIVDLTGNHVPAAVVPLGSLIPHAKSGKVRILGQSGDSRSPIAPDVPTLRELGHAALAGSGWYGLIARAGTPAETVRRYNEIVVQAIRTPEMAKRMRDWQLDARELNPAQFANLIKSDSERWAAVVKSAGFSLTSE